LGELRVLEGDRIIDRFRTQKAAWLLAYLALRVGQSAPRERLIDLFWPEMDPVAGRDNLSTALSSLRRQIEPAGMPAGSVLYADRQHVRLNPEVVVTDTAEFEHLMRAASHTAEPGQRATLLERATTLYRGELLPGCYEDWALQEQARWSERYGDALEELSEAHEQAGDLQAALSAAQRAVRADAYREGAYQRQMRLCAVLGRVSAALAAYDELERVLKRDLGVAPAAATRELRDQIRRDPHALARPRAAPPAPREAVPAPAVRDALPVPESPSMAPVALSLPVELTRFFGRERELALLGALLAPTARSVSDSGEWRAGTRDAGQPDARLITLTGPGGAGKTRLAVTVARRGASAYAGRVWFVDLGGLPDPNLIPFALAGALRLPPAPGEEPLERVVSALGDAPCLLLLDNFEHLLRDASVGSKSETPASGAGGAALVRLLIERVPGLTCLVTSRRPLHLGGEQEFPVLALDLPEPDGEPERLLQCSSVALYADRARAVKPDFAVTERNCGAVAALCRRLEGVPLAIEMAAAWARSLPPARILERLDHQLDLLVSRRRDLPARQQSLRATIQWSYDLLSPELRACFARLSVFRGGWTLEAAEAVCAGGEEEAVSAVSPTLRLLSDLQEQSLVVAEEREEDTRYRMLEPLREYAREKVSERGEIEAMRARHAGHFLSLAEADPQVANAAQKRWLDRMEMEYDNLRAALEWSQTEEGDAEMGLRLAGALWRFWEVRGHRREGYRWLEAALARAPRRNAAGLRALSAAGNIARDSGDLAVAQAHVEERLAIVRELGDREGVADALNFLGLLAQDRGDTESAHALYQECLAIMREVGHRPGIASSLYNLGSLARHRGDHEEARVYWDECRKVDIQLGIKGGYVLWALGQLAWERGDTAAAGQYWYAALMEHREIGNPGAVIKSVEYLASLAVAEGEYERAARLWGAAIAQREAQGGSLTRGGQRAFERDAAAIRSALGDAGFGSALAEGRALTSDQACDDALRNPAP
jgi:predicted ATPase/DNA-binding SARP family transcriptional activator